MVLLKKLNLYIVKFGAQTDTKRTKSIFTTYPKIHSGVINPRQGLWEREESALTPAEGFPCRNYIPQKGPGILEAHR